MESPHAVSLAIPVYQEIPATISRLVTFTSMDALTSPTRIQSAHTSAAGTQVSLMTLEVRNTLAKHL